MSLRVYIGVFDRAADVVGATQASRDRGLIVTDVFTPYAVHGLDRAMGLKPSRLSWVCFLLGTAGLGFITWFQFWASAVSWPINVGGRPWNSLPAFVPAMFEVAVLTAGVGTVLAFFITRLLFPGKRALMPDLAATNDRFVLVIEESGAGDAAMARQVFREFGSVRVEERDLEEAR